MASYQNYAPEYNIKINGESIPARLRAAITSVNYQDGVEGADQVQVALANADLRLLDHPLLQIDNKFELAIGYAPDPLLDVFVGEITGVEASFPSGGMPTINIVAHDFLQRLTVGAKDRAFAIKIPKVGHFPVADPDIVTLVSFTNGLLPAVDPVGGALSFLSLGISYALNPLDAKKAIRFQQGESDFDFLSGIARQNGWDMYIDHDQKPRGHVLRFKFLLQDYAPSVSLTWGESLMDFNPRYSSVGQVSGVSARIWIPAAQLEIVFVLGWDDVRRRFDLRVYPGIQSLEEVLDESVSQSIFKIQSNSPAMAPNQALAELLERLYRRLTASGSAIGNPNIRSGKVIALQGLGARFSGLYRITNTTHTFDSGGYKTSFEVRHEPWFGGLPTPPTRPSLFRLQGQSIGRSGS